MLVKKRLPTQARPYQRQGIKLLHKFRGRAILADEMGLGKSLQSIRYAMRHTTGPIVVVCPAGLKENWRREAWLHGRIRGYICNHYKPKPSRLLKHKARMFIIGYEVLGLPRTDDTEPKSWNDVLQELEPSLLIVDEGQACKNRKALRSLCVKALALKCKKRIILTGTPILNRPEELWMLLNITRPDLYPSHLLYCLRYCDPKRNRYGGWDFRGASNLDELNGDLVGKVLIRRLKKDVIKDLPDKIRQVIPLELEARAFMEYQKAEAGIASWLSKTNRFLERKSAALRTAKFTNEKKKIQRSIRALRAEKLAKLVYLKRLAAELKIPAVIAWIETFLESTDDKLIVYGIHHSILRPLYRRFKKVAVLVDGGVTDAKRYECYDKFNKDKDCRLLFGNYEAAGVGWSCKSATCVLGIEFPWTPATLRQAEDRIHGVERGLKGRKAMYWYLAALGTLEENLIKMLDRKQIILDRAIDGRRVYDFDILERFEESLLAKAQRKVVRRASDTKKATHQRRLVH